MVAKSLVHELAAVDLVIGMTDVGTVDCEGFGDVIVPLR